MTNLDINLEEENLEGLVEELQGSKVEENEENIGVHNQLKLDVKNLIVLKHQCDICKKRVMTKKGLILHV